jgi:prepilin-type N-terminal cleavage/methylation domain-containing protein
MSNKKNQAGLTLIEMMIALVLGLFVTAAIITVFSTNVRSSTENLKMIRLNQELRGTMALMVDELKRAGYSQDSDVSDFIDGLNRVNSTCILYSYDENENGTQESSNERFGFRLDPIENEIIWVASASSACSFGTGSDVITESNIASIVTLDFTANEINIGGTNVHEIQITLVGETTLPHSDDPIKREIIETVRIRNYDPD